MSLPVEVIYMDSFLSYRTAPILGWRFVGPDNRRQPITRDYAERRTGARAARYRNGQVYDPRLKRWFSCVDEWMAAHEEHIEGRVRYVLETGHGLVLPDAFNSIAARSRAAA